MNDAGIKGERHGPSQTGPGLAPWVIQAQS